MSETLFSSQWFRVARLKPRLRSNVRSYRHYYRGVVWYVVLASAARSRLRIDAAAFHVLSQLNGERSVDEIWKNSLNVLGDDAPSQDEILHLLIRAFDAGLVDFQQQTDVDQLFEDSRTRMERESFSRYWNPLFLRFGVFDPDRLIQRLAPYTRWVFSPITFYLWLALMLIGGLTAAFVIEDISAQFDSTLLSPTSVVIFWVVFPLMKLVHEAAHALAVKRWGGEVNECGFSVLVLVPVPYVDASDSARFSSKYRRMAVAAAGIIAETTIAAMALMLWTIVEPGLVRDIAFNAFVTGSVSSLLFNGNPLLKFDSYYVLSDWIEVPNLAGRSNQYLLHLIRRYFLGLASRSPVTACGERIWFVGYGLCALIYRLALTLGISIFVASQYFFVGVLLALWSLGMQIFWPLMRGIGFLVRNPGVRTGGLRPYAVVAAFVVAVAGVLLFVPVPSSTSTRGIVWPVDDAMVRAQTDCFVEAVFPASGEPVLPGQELIRCDATQIEAEVRNLEADYLAARAALFATRDRVERGMRQSEVDTAAELLSAARAELDGSVVSAGAAGRFFAHDAQNLPGRYFAKGELIGYLLSDDNLSVRAVLDQERAAFVERYPAKVELRSVAGELSIFPSAIVRRVPSASQRLVTPALGALGGGDLVVDMSDDSGTLLSEAAFELELRLPPVLSSAPVGLPLQVRFDHGKASIADLLVREIRLVFLRHFDV